MIIWSIFVSLISNIFVNFSATIDTYMKCLTILESPWRWLKGSEVKGAQDAAKNKSRTPEYLYRIINLCTVLASSLKTFNYTFRDDIFSLQWNFFYGCFSSIIIRNYLGEEEE